MVFNATSLLLFVFIHLLSSANKTDLHYITEILLKVALNTINQTKPINWYLTFVCSFRFLYTDFCLFGAILNLMAFCLEAIPDIMYA
jgi:hypothetical protein